VPDRILLKPGPLTADGWAIMRRHPIWGAEILAQGDGFEVARRIARWHHENRRRLGLCRRRAGRPDSARGAHRPDR